MTDTATQEAPAKRTLSPEHKARMAAGRKKAAKARAEEARKPTARKGTRMPTASQWNHRHEGKGEHIDVAPGDFAGLTPESCADGCKDGHCVITLRNHCGHPGKGGIQSVDQMNPKAVGNFHKVRKLLAHLAVDRK